MILGIWESLNEIASEFEKFVESNHDNYLFWIILFALLLLLAVTFISKMANK